jgi:hypothetical protein
MKKIQAIFLAAHIIIGLSAPRGPSIAKAAAGK